MKMNYCTLAEVVGFYIEHVPVLKNPTAKQLMQFVDDVNGTSYPNAPQEMKDVMRLCRMTQGCGDHRRERAHTERQSLVMFKTKKAAEQVARAMNHDQRKIKDYQWTARVRQIRIAS